MPARSGPQYRLMVAAAHNEEIAKRRGISQKVAREFVKKTPASLRSKWSQKRLQKVRRYLARAKHK